MSTVLEVKNLSFAYQNAEQKALEDISFSVEKGEFFFVIGQNESGKSTLCSALVGLIPHLFPGEMEGDVFVLSENTRECSVADLALKIGFVFQNPFNQLSYTTTTVAEELAFGLGNLGVPRQEMRQRVQEVAKLLSITSLLDKNPLELSGGQMQRVAIGSAFVMHPQILVLDECTAQLDPLGTREVFEVVKRLNQNGVTVIMVDHQIERVAEYADHILLINRSKQIALGTAREILSELPLEQYDLEPPDYVKISRRYRERGWWSGPVALKESETIQMTKEILSK
jgi:energy-coupling factor transport system ATP-binding protein